MRNGTDEMETGMMTEMKTEKEEGEHGRRKKENENK